MPELPPSKRRPPLSQPVVASPSRGSYAELHCRTNFSFLEGASHPDELAERAVALGLHALAVTDCNSLAGVVRTHAAAKPLGLKLVIGSEIVPTDAPPLLLWAPDRQAYGRLSRLLTAGRRRAPKGECQLTFDDVAAHAQGLLAGILLPPPLLLADADPSWLARYGEVFGDRAYAVAELHRGPDDARQLQRMQELSRRARVPLVAANDVHYHTADRRYLQDVLVAIRRGCTVVELGDEIFPNGERHLKSSDEMQQLFAQLPEAVTRTREVADRCTFSLDELRYEYPEELCPAGTTPMRYLEQLTWEGAKERYGDKLPDKIRGLIEHELQLIEELHYEAYFLTVWDLMRFARDEGILCQGRGSAANSAVCYCLKVTSVDPERIDVLFERFVSKERDEAPDIDIDFEHERREEVLQYIYQKYGRERAGMTAEVITYRPRSAVRDIGKALGLSLDRVDALAKAFEHHDDRPDVAVRFREAGVNPQSRLGRQMLILLTQILGFPRHLSQHVGGMVMTRGPLCELVPIENASMPDRTVIQWDKDDLDTLGILKVDCLGLGMLTAIHKCFDLIERNWGGTLTLADVPAEDPEVYDMICEADTIGVFQIESRAQMSMLPRLRPRCFYDLVIEVAIVRPGPIQGEMVHPYLRRRAGKEAVSYPDERVRSVLEKTMGVPIFQEQAMRLAVVAAGFTPGEADQLRRAMGAWRRTGVMEQFERKLIDGMRARGYTPEFARGVFQQIRGFGQYGFPESHSASFALLVYISSWLKHYYPAAFAAAMLNSQPLGFYAPAQLIGDARRHGVQVHPVDVAASDWDCTLEEGDEGAFGVRLGMRQIKGMSSAHAERIVAARATGPFTSIEDFARRTHLGRPVLERLSQADAFASLGTPRRQALWRAWGVGESSPLFDAVPVDAPPVELPPRPPQAEVAADYRTMGLSLRGHPMGFLRPQLEERQVVRAADLIQHKSGRWIRVAGIVLLRQRPGTASGITFVTLEDETGPANLIIRPEVWQRNRRVARMAHAVIAHGHLQIHESIVHVLVEKLEDLSPLVADLNWQSRDFR